MRKKMFNEITLTTATPPTFISFAYSYTINIQSISICWWPCVFLSLRLYHRRHKSVSRSYLLNINLSSSRLFFYQYKNALRFFLLRFYAMAYLLSYHHNQIDFISISLVTWCFFLRFSMTLFAERNYKDDWMLMYDA